MEDKKKYKLVSNNCLKECNTFKEKLNVCMKNSDNNIIVCQQIRNDYENCLLKFDKNTQNSIYNDVEDTSLTN